PATPFRPARERRPARAGLLVGVKCQQLMLEREPQPELDDAGIVSSGDMTEASAVNVRTGRSASQSSVAIIDYVGVEEVRMVEDVKEFRAKFQFQPFRNGCGLGQRQVKIYVTLAA